MMYGRAHLRGERSHAAVVTQTIPPPLRLVNRFFHSLGLIEEAYKRYALAANHRMTNVENYRALATKYPQKRAKRFATAMDAGLFDEAIELAGN